MHIKSPEPPFCCTFPKSKIGKNSVFFGIYWHRFIISKSLQIKFCKFWHLTCLNRSMEPREIVKNVSQLSHLNPQNCAPKVTWTPILLHISKIKNGQKSAFFGVFRHRLIVQKSLQIKFRKFWHLTRLNRSNELREIAKNVSLARHRLYIFSHQNPVFFSLSCNIA